MDQYIPPGLGRYSKAVSATYGVTIGDAGFLLSCTGTFQINLPAPATIGANFSLGIMNVGSGTITVSSAPAYIISTSGLTDTSESLGSGRGIIIGCNGTSYFVVSTNYDEVGSAFWGNITGTLSNQTDLRSALDAKADETITITGTSMLAGGGDLTANRTINLASAAANTILGNNTGSPAVPIAMTVAQTKTLLAYTPADIGAQSAVMTVTNRTADLTVGAANSSYSYENTGATALTTFTLDAAATVGTFIRFVVLDADGIKVLATSGKFIIVGTTVSSNAGYTTSTAIGSTIELLKITSTQWVATTVTGTWTTA